MFIKYRVSKQLLDKGSAKNRENYLYPIEKQISFQFDEIF